MRLFIILIIIITFFGCGVPRDKHEALKKEYEQIKEQFQQLQLENQKLKTDKHSLIVELDALKYGPRRLLSTAKYQIQQQDYKNAANTIATLLAKHPESNEVKEGKELRDKITKSLEDLAQAKEKKKYTALKKLYSSYDEIEKITWVEDKYLHNSSGNRLYIYMGITDVNSPWLRLAIRYVGNDWIFIDKYVVQVDGVNYYINPKTEINRKVLSHNYVSETLDMKLDSNTTEMVKAILNSKKTIVRFTGRNHVFDYQLEKNEIQGLKDLIDGYISLGYKL